MISNQCADTLLFQIKVCETCQHTERNKNLARTVRPIKVDAPWDIVGIDIIGEYMKIFVSAWFFSPGSDACSFFPHQGLSRRPSKATPMLRSSLIILVNGLRLFQCKRQMLSLLGDAFPNVYTGENPS